MIRELPRTTLAVGLVAVTLLIPSVAWYVAGSREAERAAARLLEEPTRQSQAAAARMAERLATRLEMLVERESSRPYYHYQSFYHDPGGASEGASVVPSPLARGLQDPLVLAHFQVSAAGKLVLPNASAAEPRRGQALERQLAATASEATAWLRQSKSASTKAPDRSAGSPQIVALDPSAYAQNVQADKVVAQIRKQTEVKLDPPVRNRAVQVEVGPLEWRTVTLGSGRALAALRVVRTPDDRFVQGFVVDSSEVGRLLAVAGLPVSFAPRAAGATAVTADVPATGWSVTVEGASSLAGVRAASAVRERFRQQFTFGAVLAILGGLCVVGLVWQSERLARRRSQFAASAAHELRTPLAGLRMYGDMLADGLGDPSQSKRYARMVSAEAERLGRVVSNVLGFSRLERGRLRINPERGDVAAAVREAIERQRPVFEAAGARIELQVADDLPAARFDRDALAQILQNLLDNAERYSRGAADRTLRVSLDAADGTVALRVSDRGSGVPVQARSRLFHPFAQVGDADPSSGLGLGLAIVRSLARAQGGSAEHADRPEGGSTFIVKLPAAS